jgi:hypothetical protein
MTEMQMSKLTYREQLLHPNWQRKRLEILNRDSFRCCACDNDQRTLHVHHKQYVSGRMAWEYPNEELATLCELCHDITHYAADSLKEVFAQLPFAGKANLYSAHVLLAGWATGEQGLDFTAKVNEDPHTFVAGELANRLGETLSLDEAMRLVVALSNGAPWVVRDVMRTATAQITERVNETPPPGYVQSLDDIDL